MLKLRKVAAGEPLIVAMTAVRMGDRLLIIGAEVPKVIAQLAPKPALTGRACVVDDDAARVARASALALGEGVQIEDQVAPVTALPFGADAFDVVVVNHALALLAPERRAPCLTEAARVRRPGGRCVVIERGRRGGLAGLLSSAPPLGSSDVEALLGGAGFRAVHMLASREGLLFVEGAKPSVAG